MRSYHSYSSEETKKLAGRVAKTLVRRTSYVVRGRRRGALVIALQGDLGAGKTTFVQGFLKGLGIRKRAVSPTFVIMRSYRVPDPLSPPKAGRPLADAIRSKLHHMDAYRLRKPEDVMPLGFKKILADPRNILLVEWPENIKGALPKNCIKIKFTYGKKESERKISF